MDNITKEFVINNSESERKSVLFAMDIANCAKDFQGEVYIEKDGRRVLGRSLIGVLSLALKCGDNIKIECVGGMDFPARLCLERIGKVLR